MTTIRLKIKNLTLAQEARIIRRKENSMRKWKKRISEQHKAALQTIQGQVDPKALPTGIFKGLKKYEYKENRQYDPDVRHDLREYRLKVVRPMARASHLALGYMKNMPYRVMERMAYDSPDWKEVWKNVTRFGVKDADKQRFLDWADTVIETPKDGAGHNKPNLDYTVVQNKSVSWLIKYQLKWEM